MKLYLSVITLILFSLNVSGQKSLKDTTADKESFAVGELGSAFSKNINGTASYGFNASVEVTPIQDVLEIELGLTPTFAKKLKALDADLLFKKPWSLSARTEIMAGIGLAYDHENDQGLILNSMSGELAFDLMYWPFAKHEFGIYVEPGYEYGLAQQHEQSIEMSAGLIVAIP